MSKNTVLLLSLIWPAQIKANSVQLPRADLDSRAEMGPSVSWNNLLIELFWPKLCSNGFKRGWIRLGLQGGIGTSGLIQIFSIFSVVNLIIVYLYHNKLPWIIFKVIQRPKLTAVKFFQSSICLLLIFASLATRILKRLYFTEEPGTSRQWIRLRISELREKLKLNMWNGVKIKEQGENEMN